MIIGDGVLDVVVEGGEEGRDGGEVGGRVRGGRGVAEEVGRDG